MEKANAGKTSSPGGQSAVQENAEKTRGSIGENQTAAKDISARGTENSAQSAAPSARGSESAGTAAAAAPDAPCGSNRGSLPGFCAPLAFPYVPKQDSNPVRYSRMEALETGTLFPGLNLPFKTAIQARTQLANTALVELMALDFAIQELGLYLTTHAEDQEALGLYWSYIQMAKEGREKYARRCGPLLETDLTPEDGFAWLKDPWPWDLGGNA